MEKLKEFQNKVKLHKDFTTSYGKPSLIIEGLVPLVNLPYVLYGQELFPLSRVPSIWIMTVGTAHRTALQEDYQAHAWSIYGTHSFNGVDMTFHTILDFR